MKIELVQVFDIGEYLLKVSKKIESNFVPRKGDFISDSAFEGEVHEVAQVNIDLELQTCTVVLATVILPGNYITETQKIADVYGPHNWFRI